MSASGETSEILELLPTIKRLGVPLVTMTGDCLHGGNGGRASSLAQAADVALDCSIQKEACSLGLAPTASTTTMLALGDALAVELSERRGFRAEDFADLHPGGKLGKRLARVSQLMHSGEAIPRVAPETPMIEVIYEMSRKGLGVTAVIEGEALIGIVSDGDLRRLLEHRGKDALDLTAGQCMTAKPSTISSRELCRRGAGFDGAEEDHFADGGGRGQPAGRRGAPARFVGRGAGVGGRCSGCSRRS